MRKAELETSWVVYLMAVHKKVEGGRAICRQEEWDAMELAHPGEQTLIQGGIANEGEAERLARGTAGDRKQVNRAGKARSPFSVV